jgi:hypothetical protein
VDCNIVATFEAGREYYSCGSRNGEYSCAGSRAPLVSESLVSESHAFNLGLARSSRLSVISRAWTRQHSLFFHGRHEAVAPYLLPSGEETASYANDLTHLNRQDSGDWGEGTSVGLLPAPASQPQGQQRGTLVGLPGFHDREVRKPDAVRIYPPLLLTLLLLARASGWLLRRQLITALLAMSPRMAFAQLRHNERT